MNEQVMIYEVKSGAHANAEKLFSPDRKYFYWNDKYFGKLNVGDYVFVVDRIAPRVLFTQLDGVGIPVEESAVGSLFSDLGVSYEVQGKWSAFVRLRILEEIVPPAGWSWKSLGSTEIVYLGGARINPEFGAKRIENIHQLRSLSNDDHYQQVLSECERQFMASNVLIPAIVKAIQDPSIQQLIAEEPFHFQLAQEALARFENFPGSPEFFNEALDDFQNRGLTFTNYMEELDSSSPKRELFDVIGALISYIDLHAANKETYNRYKNKHTLARSGIRQTVWVRDLIKYRAAGNRRESVLPGVQNAIAYLKDPATELTLLSEDHRLMVSQNLLKAQVYRKEEFVAEVLKFFEPYQINPRNPENLTRIISLILYMFPDVEKLWKHPDQAAIPLPTPDEPVGHDLSFGDPNRAVLLAIKTKPFVLLAGLSGTGKSRLVRTLAFQTCWDKELQTHPTKPGNFELIPVRPNWHDSAELMGYVSRINNEKYVTTALLKFISKAWRHSNVPFFLCLDEMNLAPVEQYFAEYLSILETRSPSNGALKSDFIIARSDFENPALYDEILRDLDISGDPRFVDGISLPQNLVVVGTVNMDETTHSFSRKVLDRAMTIEMNTVDLNAGLSGESQDWSYPESFYSFDSVVGSFSAGSDVYGNFPEAASVIEFLEKLNRILVGSPFRIAYRVRDEFLIYCYFAAQIPDKPTNWLDRALDEITSMKVLSRIEGDEGRTDKIVNELGTLFGDDFIQSRAKLKEMAERLKSSGYTSFWA